MSKFGAKRQIMASKKKSLPNPDSIRSSMQYEIDNFGQLGKRIEIGARTKVTINKPGMGVKFYTPTISVLIGIGKDHIAHLVMEKEAWDALVDGAEISIDTLTDFKKNFL